MSRLRIALLQLTPCGAWEENLAKGIRACRRAQEMGADIALFPEMWSNGYGIEGRPFSEWKQEAVSAGGTFVQQFGQLAGKLRMAVGITFLEQYGEGGRNSLILFDRWGERRLPGIPAFWRRTGKSRLPWQSWICPSCGLTGAWRSMAMPTGILNSTVFL